MPTHNLPFVNECPGQAARSPGIAVPWRAAALGALVVTSIGCGGAQSPAPTASAPPRQSVAYVDRCQDAVRRDIALAIDPADVRFATGVAIAARPDETNVRGEADVRSADGRAERYRYSCSFDPAEGGRVARSGYDRIEEPAVAPTGSLVERCQADVRRTMNADVAPNAAVRFVGAQSVAVNARVTNVQGDAEVQSEDGAPRRYSYFCSFESSEGDRSGATSMEPNAVVGDTNASSLVKRCQDDIERRVSAELGPAHVRFQSGRAVPIDASTTNVRGEARVERSGAPEQRYSYECAFQPRNGDQPVSADYRLSR